MNFSETIKQRLSKKDLLDVFVITAFPVHVWAIAFILKDIPWMTDRTSLGDALGVGAYGMVSALIESILYFIPITLLYILIPHRYPRDKALAITACTALLIASWAGAEQFIRYISINVTLFNKIIDVLLGTGNPIGILFTIRIIFYSLLFVSIILPITVFSLKDKAQMQMIAFIEKVQVLTFLYLFLDVVGIISVILRNTTG